MTKNKKKVAVVAPKRKGRPQKSVSFPAGKFTVDSVFTLNTGRLKRPMTRVCVSSHINSAVKSGEVLRLGKLPQKGRGHPTYLYIKAKSVKTKPAAKPADTAKVEEKVS